MGQLQTRRAKVGDVRNWIEALGVLCCDNMTPTEAEMKVLAYVPLLQADFPPEVFTQDSLAAVAKACKYFPAYAEVHTHLSAWWRERRPIPVALPEPVPERRPEPTEEEKARVSATVATIVAELRTTAILRDTEGRSLPPEPPRSRALYLSPAELDIVNPLPNGRKRERSE
jgi:hypothetical protein